MNNKNKQPEDIWFDEQIQEAVNTATATQKSEIISLIYAMILNKEVDDVSGAKIINKIRQ